MARFEAHIIAVGHQTSNTMKFILHNLLSKRYTRLYEPEFAGKLAAEVANYLFEDIDGTKSAFAEENTQLIHEKAEELSDDDPLCHALTCAVYNFSYAKYVECGGKVGFLFHPFLGYVRALQGGDDAALERFYESKKIPFQAYGPLIHLMSLKLIRRLPWTPNSKIMLNAVVAFGNSVGCSFQTSLRRD
jgi:hypothetical protein